MKAQPLEGLSSSGHEVLHTLSYDPAASVVVCHACLRVYSYTAMAPLTCTFSERTTPPCGISTQQFKACT